MLLLEGVIIIKFNITLIDGTYLDSVILSSTRDNMSIGEFKTYDQFLDWFNSEKSKIIYFCGKYIQGGISSPKIIKNYEIIEDHPHYCTLICSCGKVYDYIPTECSLCGNTFVD